MMASMAAAPRRAAALLAGVLTFSSTAALASLLACLPAATKAGLVWLADSTNLGAAGEAANMSSSLAVPSSALDMFAAVPASLLPFLAAGAAAFSSATLVFLAANITFPGHSTIHLGFSPGGFCYNFLFGRTGLHFLLLTLLAIVLNLCRRPVRLDLPLGRLGGGDLPAPLGTAPSFP